MTDRFTDYDNDLESQPTFEDSLEELKNDSESLPSPALIVGLSELSSEQLAQLGPIWEGLSRDYRRILMQMLVDAAASNFMLNFQPIGYATLTSEEADVRQAAIELLAEDETTGLFRTLIDMVQNDPEDFVRAEAARSLGRFILGGEMGDFNDNIVETAQNTLLRIIANEKEDIQVRRFAVEAIANCTRDEVPKVIAEAYRNPDSTMRLSAIIAMGRSYDERWEDKVLDELTNTDDDMRIAAIQSAGELQLSTAVGQIIKNITDGEREEQEVAIVALGEIGGKEALRILQSLQDGAEETDDSDLLEIIDDAMASASLINGDHMMVNFTDLED
ncbi:MAG: HEAT repeat domain-containing protein [Phototrophicaceae bacterium]